MNLKCQLALLLSWCWQGSYQRVHKKELFPITAAQKTDQILPNTALFKIKCKLPVAAGVMWPRVTAACFMVCVPPGSAGILPGDHTTARRCGGSAWCSGCCRCPSTGGKSAGSLSSGPVRRGSVPRSPRRWSPAGTRYVRTISERTRRFWLDTVSSRSFKTKIDDVI